MHLLDFSLINVIYFPVEEIFRKKTKDIIICGLFTALLLASQISLSFIGGVEIVTLLLLCYAYSFGAKYSMLSATAFSLIRCIIFGFYPTVIIEYLIYYNLFSLFFSFLGKRLGKINFIKQCIVVIFACAFTCMFTLLDDFITPLYYGIDFYPYFISSLPFMAIQCSCTFITVFPLVKPIVNTIQAQSRK